MPKRSINEVYSSKWEPDITIYSKHPGETENYLWQCQTKQDESTSKLIDIDNREYHSNYNRNQKSFESMFNFLIDAWKEFWKPDPGQNEQLYCELAAVGGNIFKALYGIEQPHCYTGQSHTNDQTTYHRIGEFLKFAGKNQTSVAELLQHNTNSVLLKNILHFNNCKPQGKPAYGVILNFIFSLFLGDSDIKNFSLITGKQLSDPNNKNAHLLDKENYYRAVRFDTEGCFCPLYWLLSVEDLYCALKCLADYELSFGEPADENSIEDYANNTDETKITAFFNQVINYQLDKEEPFWSSDNAFKDIFYANWREFEVYAGLARIFELDFKVYENIIDRDLSPQFAEQKKLLKFHFREYLKIFKECASRLPTFALFHEAYLDSKHEVSIFWHNFFGDPLKPKIPEGYTCYEPVDSSKQDDTDVREFNGHFFKKFNNTLTTHSSQTSITLSNLKNKPQ